MLNNSVFVVPFFGPRIRKEEPNFFERCFWRQGAEEFAGFALDEMTVRQMGSRTLAVCAGNSVA